MVKILIAMAIFFTYALQFYVPINIIWNIIKNRISDKWKMTADLSVRTGLVTLTSKSFPFSYVRRPLECHSSDRYLFAFSCRSHPGAQLRTNHLSRWCRLFLNARTFPSRLVGHNRAMAVPRAGKVATREKLHNNNDISSGTRLRDLQQCVGHHSHVQN